MTVKINLWYLGLGYDPGYYCSLRSVILFLGYGLLVWYSNCDYFYLRECHECEIFLTLDTKYIKCAEFAPRRARPS